MRYAQHMPIANSSDRVVMASREPLCAFLIITVREERCGGTVCVRTNGRWAVDTGPGGEGDRPDRVLRPMLLGWRRVGAANTGATQVRTHSMINTEVTRTNRYSLARYDMAAKMTV